MTYRCECGKEFYSPNYRIPWIDPTTDIKKLQVLTQIKELMTFINNMRT